MPNHVIDVWLVDEMSAVSPDLQAAYLELLSSEEKLRHQKLMREQDKLLYLTAKALTRSVLSHYHQDVAPNHWQFKPGRHGKPSINNPLAEPLHFNLSHTHSLIGLAVQQSHPIGLDVENHHRSNNLPGLAEQVFSETERNYLANLNAADFRAGFFKLWTLKEAFVKATGKGIAAGLKSFEFYFEHDEIKVGGKNPDTKNDWYFYHQYYSTNYSLAIAANTYGQSLKPQLNFYTGIPILGFEAVPSA